MSTSPNRPTLPAPTNPPHLSSPRSTRTLRKLQSANALSSNYNASNAPAVPTLHPQQRQQLAHRTSGMLREPQQQQQQQQQSSTHLTVGPLPAFVSNQSQVRNRTNSDLAPVLSNTGAALSSRRMGLRRVNSSEGETKEDFEGLIRHGPKGDVMGSLKQLRKLVLLGGVEADSDGMSHHRIYTWLILLNCPSLPTDTYLSLIHRGPSPAYSKIRNDTFRTLATDPLFKRRVSEASLIRLLNAVAWKLHDAKLEASTAAAASPSLTNSSLASPPEHPSPARKHAQSAASTTTAPSVGGGSQGGGTEPGVYVQGMNVLCAPFLYAARSETEAFAAFHLLLTTQLPSYVRGAMIGVHRGLALVDKCLGIIDSKLHTYLLSKGLAAELYAFPSVLTLCACTPPLPEVLVLWDFLFAFGVHLNVLCVVAQLVLMREELMGSRSPGVLLRAFPPLRAREVVEMAVSFVEKIPPRVYGELVEHGR